MKKLNLVFLSTLMALCLVAFSACNDDDDDKKAVIAGEWQLKAVDTDVQSSMPEVDDAIKTYVLNKYSVPANDAKLSLVLSADGKYMIKDEANKELERGTYKYEKGKLTLTVSENIPKETAEPVAPVVKVYTVDLATGTLNLKADVLTAIAAEIKEEGKWLEIVGADKEMPANFKMIASNFTLKYNVKPQPK